MNLSLWGAQAWFSLHWFTVLGWGLAASLAAMIGLAYVDERNSKIRVIRLLEYHAMHMAWLRSLCTDSAVSDAVIRDGPRVVRKHREALLNLTPSLIPQSAADAFRGPASYDLSQKTPQVSGVSLADERAELLAQIDYLSWAIRAQWCAFGGVKAEKP